MCIHPICMALQKDDRRFSLSNIYFSFIQRRKTSDRFLCNLALVAVLLSSLYVIFSINSFYVTSIPTTGGTIVEGIIGTPRFVNPVLAINRADHDMTALIYSGLLKLDENGSLVNDVAESIELSEDGLTYNIKIRKDILFHNGMELKTRDLAYTIALIQNPDLKSPLRGNWDGVRVEELDDYELNIILEEAYTPFVENLTLGILPRELWDGLPIEQIPFSQNNTEPVGTGPYKVTDVLRNKSGLINAYELSAFNDSEHKPNISTLVFNFYQNEEDLLEALNNKKIASTPSLSPENFQRIDADEYQIIQNPLPRTFAIYFNQNKSVVLRDESARKALSIAIDRQKLVDTVLYGYGIPTESPVPTGFLTVESASSTENKITDEVTLIEKAKIILVAGGWRITDSGTWEKEIDKSVTTLTVSITTANSPLFDKTTTQISETWKKLGVEVNVSQFEQTDLVQAIIRPRDFEALLYGADIGRQTDLYPFWHSSQKNDPGLNIAQYTNIDVDTLLKRTRTQNNEELRSETIHKIEEIIKKETPAVFLFVPIFGYVLDKDVTVTPFTKLSTQSERFANVSSWHIQSNNLWPIFSNKK